MKFYAVIPVYNVAEYITEFLESLIMQDDTDISYILINDGSTDNSGSICDEYAQRDNRLIVKHTANQGVSKARNTGLEIVLKEGNDNDYVLFFDPDDYLTSPQAVSLIRRNLSQLPDILTYNHLSNNKPASQNIKTGGNFEGKEIGQKLFPSYLCGKLINGDRINSGLFQSAFSLGVIRRNNIRFREDIRKAEDTLFYAQFLTYVNRAVLANITPYNYRIRSNSLTTTYRKPSEIGARKGISILNELRYWGLKCKGIDVMTFESFMVFKYRKVFENYSIGLSDFNNKDSLFEKYRNLTEFCKFPVVQEIKKIILSEHASIPRKIRNAMILPPPILFSYGLVYNTLKYLKHKIHN